MSIENKHIIMWQKWRDPFGEDDHQEFIDSISEDHDYNNFQHEEDISDHNNDLHDDDKKNMDLLKPKSNIRVIATPMGIIPFTENTASSKIFNFWVGHTNFNITKKITSLIEETNGVETLDIFTRYRFRIAIGKAFKDASVMRDINETIYEYLE